MAGFRGRSTGYGEVQRVGNSHATACDSRLFVGTVTKVSGSAGRWVDVERARMDGAILHIDDVSDLPSGFRPELERLKFCLIQVDDPQQAISVVRNEDVELILLEVLLTRFDGFALLEDIRNVCPELPVVILTKGDRTPELYARALELGANEFLTKPVLASQLLTTVRDLTGRKQPTAEGQKGSRRSDVIADDLEECPLAEFLHRLQLEGASGACVVRKNREQRGIQLRNGSPVAITTNQKQEPFEDFLKRTGRLNQRMFEEVAAQLSFGMGTTEEILLGLGAISEDEIMVAQREQTEERFFELFGWESGTLRFYTRKRLKTGTANPIERDPEDLLFQGAMRCSTPAQISRALGQRGSLYGSRVSNREDRLPGLEPRARALLQSLDGDHSVSELMADPAVDDRLLYALWISGLLELIGEPVLMLQEPVEDVLETDEVPELLETGSTEIVPIEVREASGAMPLDSDDAQQATERAHQAESWFRTGRGHLIAKDYNKAVEAFGMASHLDPSEGDYVAHLGYVLYLSRPSHELVRREAMEHIAKGIKLSPERESPYLFLARIFKASKDIESARKVLRRASRLHPKSVELKRELRILTVGKKKRKGFLKRLFGL